MKIKSIIVAGLTATLLSTGFTYAQTTTAPAEVQILVKNENMAQIPEVMAMIESLKAEGYTYFEIGRTLLGRAKIMAYGEDSMREVVMNATTGEMLRNIMREHDGSMATGMAENMARGGVGGMGGGNGTGGMGGGMGGN